MREIDEILEKKENISILSKEIIKIFQETANSENVEYNFSIGEDGKVSSDQANTYFAFDTPKDSFIHKFKKSMFNDDLNDIKENSEEEKELMQKIREYLYKVCEDITNNYKEQLEEVIRRVILGNKMSNDKIPLNKIELLMMDISDYDSVPEYSKYLLRIYKTTESVKIDTDSITIFIQNQQEETGKTPEEIFLIERRKENPLFDNITGISQGHKFLNDVILYFFVDYSL